MFSFCFSGSTCVDFITPSVLKKEEKAGEDHGMFVLTWQTQINSIICCLVTRRKTVELVGFRLIVESTLQSKPNNYPDLIENVIPPLDCGTFSVFLRAYQKQIMMSMSVHQWCPVLPHQNTCEGRDRMEKEELTGPGTNVCINMQLQVL